MIVLKFGGSSVENATAMSRVLDIVEAASARDRVMLICSAIRGCTDALIEIGRVEDPEHLLEDLQHRHIKIINRLFTGPDRELAIVDCKDTFSEIRCIPATIEQYGEILSTRILARKLHCEGYKTSWLDSRELVRTLPGSTQADQGATYEAIRKVVEANPAAKIFVAQGFIAKDPSGKATTLGRGGSDYSASLFAAALDAADLQIWTDVPGILTANPRDVPSARSIPAVSYRAAFDLARYGAKVLYAPAVGPAREKGIAIRILNTFDPSHPGTVISSQESEIPEYKGVTSSTSGDATTVVLISEGPVPQEGTVRRISGALLEAGIKPLGDITVENGTNFLVPVRGRVCRSAVAAIHREFFEKRALTTLDVYIAGAGSVGSALRDILSACGGTFPAAGKQINLVEISSSHDFADRVLATARSRSVFVDCTDSKDIWRKFVPLLNAGINIVSSHRRSLAIPYADYAAIKAAGEENGCFFRYDTTVGNALPVLQSVSAGAITGGRITGIEAVVSCTLNNLFATYQGDGSESLASILRRSQDAGLTEKDPRTDLAGRDALRKLLILAREAGVPLEASEVTVHPVLPEEFFSGSIEDFYARLEAYEPQLEAQEADLDSRGMRRRFVASLTPDATAPHGFRASIRLREVGVQSPYYWIDGTQNVTVIHSSDAYPLVIKGSGEGARLAATGILKDILM